MVPVTRGDAAWRGRSVRGTGALHRRPLERGLEAGDDVGALERKVGDVEAAGRAAGGDLALEAVLLELERLDLQGGRAGRLARRAQRQLGHEGEQLAVVGRDALGRRIEVL